MTTLFKEFKLGDLFDLYMPKGLSNKDLERLETYKGVKYPLLKQTNTNNGISGYVSLPMEYLLNKENKTILIGTTNTQNLNVCDFPVFAMNVGNTYIIEHKNINKYTALYLKSAVDKVIVNKYSYNNLNALFKMKEDLISLPVKSLTDTEPDWEYMEQYIKQIEKKAILLVKEQNEKDIVLLKELVGQDEGSDISEDVEFREFKVEDLFEKKLSLKNKGVLETSRDKIDEFSLRAISATNKNNGVGFYVSPNEHNVLNNCITVSANGVNTGYIAYQSIPFAIAQDSYALEFKDTLKTIADKKRAYLYLVAAISKYSNIIYDYQTKAGWNRLKETYVTLPVNKTASELVPDWNTIEEYMKHIQQKYILLKEQNNIEELNNLLSVTGLTHDSLALDSKDLV